jgi:hypothetical protein
MFDELNNWLDRKLRVDTYELRGEEVVATGMPKHRILLKDIRTWQGFYIVGGIPFISVEFSDGHKADFNDKYEQLFEVLNLAVKDRALPCFNAPNDSEAMTWRTSRRVSFRR